MKTVVLLLCFLVPSLVPVGQVFGDEDDKKEESSLAEETIQTIKKKEMIVSIRAGLAAVAQAKKDIEEFQTEVRNGRIKFENNNGIWTAASKKHGNVVKLAKYSAQNGPMEFFTKRVYTGPDHTNELHEVGYDIYFFPSGQIKAYMRRDWDESFQYSGDGKLAKYSAKTRDGLYMAEWDSAGHIACERLGKGVIDHRGKIGVREKSAE